MKALRKSGRGAASQDPKVLSGAPRQTLLETREALIREQSKGHWDLTCPDAGASWSQPVKGESIYSLMRDSRDPRTIFAGGIGTVLKSIDGGEHWDVYNNTLPPYLIVQLEADDILGAFYAATFGAGIIRVYDEALGVNEHRENLPSALRLYPNYPNPFNPTTRISFDLPRRSRVLLEVFNIVGQNLITLFDGEKQAGSYGFDLNLEGWSSGVYIVRVVAPDRAITQPIVLMK